MKTYCVFLVVMTVLQINLCYSVNSQYHINRHQLSQQRIANYGKYKENHEAQREEEIKIQNLEQAVNDDLNIDASKDKNQTNYNNMSIATQNNDQNSQNEVLKKRDYEVLASNSEHRPVRMDYVVPSLARRKRAIQNYTIRWDYTIPYVIHSSYSNQGAYYVTILKRALRHIMNRLCLTFVDETARYNSSIYNWFVLNGYKTNGFIYIWLGSGCASDAGAGNGNQARYSYPCTDFVINTHELLHSLGGSHTHQGPIRTRYITLNNDDILPSYLYSYNPYPWQASTYNMVNTYFDAASVLMYSASTWNRNSLDAYTPIRDDIFNFYFSPSTDDINFSELNQIYQCNAKFCGNATVDCGLGYYARVKGVCRCVCPNEYDVGNNCQSLKNGPSAHLTWPNTPIVLLAGGPNHTCPTGFDPTPGWFSFTGNSTLTQSPAAPVQLPTSGKTHYTPVCSKTTPANGSIDWESWPGGGQYCFIKPAGVNCDGGFITTGAEFYSLAPVTMNGSLGETYYNSTSQNITQYYCCRYQETTTYPIDLPDAEPFRLFVRSTCPRHRDLKVYNSRLNWWTGINREIVTSKSPWWMYSNAMTTFQCYFLPPIYGCNQEVTLNSTTRSVTITTPGFPTGRTPNRRCFYSFKVPTYSQIRVTINKCDLSTTYDDWFFVKRYHKWQEALKIDVTNCPSQILSVKDFLSMEYWSGFDTVTKQGLNFTAEVILPEDMCYDPTVNGANYIGDMNYTETGEKCLNWVDAMGCSDFPSEDAFWLIQSDNKCRNPSGALDQPWCYVYKNGTNCHKRYCDVCNLKAPMDVIKTCAALKSADPNFCSTGYQRYGCFSSCGFTQVAPPTGTCNPPTIPSDGVQVGTAKSSYSIGERVQVRCTLFSTTATSEMMCTTSGWTNLTKACQDCPPGWVVYGDRCFNYITTSYNYASALSNCQSMGSSGTLFQVRDSIDQQTIRDYKTLGGSSSYPTNWISGQLESTNGRWLYSTTNTQIAYSNWTSNAVLGDMSYDCIQMIAENDANNPGAWNTSDCQSTSITAKSICQLDRNGLCLDNYDKCEQEMTLNPQFCTGSVTASFGDLYCSKSCGECANLPNCTAPTSSVYTRTSPYASIAPGNYMTFQCNAGYYYVSGDKQRACSSSGNLLGTELVCQTQPVATDINLNSIIRRSSTLTTKLAIALDKPELVIPFNGNISIWYYYCITPGAVSFLVYRKNGTSYTYVGANNVTCEADFKWAYTVPAANQIAVQANDVIGVYTTVASIAASDCSTTDKICNFPSVTANNWSEVQTKAPNATACRCISLAARVNPA